MSYRKRYSKGRSRRGSTNYVTATYQEIYDINTSSDEISIIGIHTPVGSKPRQMLSGFWTQYRKFAYLGADVIGTFAAGLPLDILAFNNEAGQANCDPRDVLNPILGRGCHGDNLTAALNSIYNGSFTDEGSSMGMDTHYGVTKPTGDLTWEQIYYRMLQDPSFKKYRMGNGFRLRNLHPMVYNVVSNFQLMPNENAPYVGALTDASGVGSGPTVFDNTTRGAIPTGHGGGGDDTTTVVTYPQFATNRLTRLGWMDTRQIMNGYYTTESGQPGYTTLPRIFMSCLVLPKAYRVQNCMRIVISHKFAFKEFNTSLTLEGANEYYDWLSAIVPDDNSKSESKDKANDTLEVLGGEATIVSDGVF